MNERLDLTALRDGVDLPPTQVAEGAWERGRRRVRRRRAAGAVGVAALVVAVAVVPTLVGPSGDTGVEPAGTPTGLPEPTRTVTSEVSVGNAVGPPLDPAVVDQGDLQRTGSVPRAPLADDPTPWARWAVATDDGALVVGPDGVLRSIEVPAGEPGSGALQATSLDADATRLALGLEDGVLLADLARGTTTTVALPPGGAVGEPVVIEGWSGDEVLVTDGSQGSVLVDAATGRVRATDYPAGTSFDGDAPVAWTGTEAVAGGTLLQTRVERDPGTLLVDGTTAVVPTSLTPQEARLDPAQRAALGTIGDTDLPVVGAVTVVDLTTGDPVAALPRALTDVGGIVEPLRIDEQTVFVQTQDGRGRPVVLRWSWETGDVEHVVTIDPPAGTGVVAWGRG